MNKREFWLIIQTDGNQKYVFASNSDDMSANVGASYLIKKSCLYDNEYYESSRIDDLFTEEKCKENDIIPIVYTSGEFKAIVSGDEDKAKAKEYARCIIEHLTKRALRDAPGLEIFGIVEEINNSQYAYALTQALGKRRREFRYSLTSNILRNQLTPFTEPCRETKVAASYFSGEAAISRQIKSQDDAAQSGYSDIKQMIESFGFSSEDKEKFENAIDEKNIVQSGGDNDERSGWKAIIHADGDRVGKILQKFSPPNNEAFADSLKEFSIKLDGLTKAALCRAVILIYKDINRPFIKPLIVGGDDITVLIDSKVAMQFAVQFVIEFRNQLDELGKQPDDSIKTTYAEDTLKEITMSVGIAYVHKRWPNGIGYDLAEELCSSAKKREFVGEDGVGKGIIGGVDFHVAYNTVASSLADIRKPLMKKYNGDNVSLYTGSMNIYQKSNGDDRDVEKLVKAVRLQSDSTPPISSAALHRIRTYQSERQDISGIDYIKDEIILRSNSPSQARDFLESNLICSNNKKNQFSRIIDILTLLDVQKDLKETEE
jgi:hypothetical protein